MKQRIEVPIIYINDEPWLLLNGFSNSGRLRAAFVSKPRHVRDTDGHHCEEVSCKTSIRYNPRRWNI